VVRRRKGILLLEVVVAMTALAVMGAAVAAVLERQARDVRQLYEERVAWEVELYDWSEE
jgi:hypothetical protein